MMKQPELSDLELFQRTRPPRTSRPTLYFERTARKDGFDLVCGVDEVGRGSLAGPVVAAAVILQPGKSITGLNDSKLLSEDERYRVADRIERRALAVAVAECSPEEIDKLNILWASLEAMRKAIGLLNVPPDYLLIDGNKAIPGIGIPYKTIVSGDARSRSIAAASIVAKCYRDRLMKKMHSAYPVYCWESNVGYGTAAHYAALDEHGPCPHHRQSFKLSTVVEESVPKLTSLFDRVETD